MSPVWCLSPDGVGLLTIIPKMTDIESDRDQNRCRYSIVVKQHVKSSRKVRVFHGSFVEQARYHKSIIVNAAVLGLIPCNRLFTACLLLPASLLMNISICCTTSIGSEFATRCSFQQANPLHPDLLKMFQIYSEISDLNRNPKENQKKLCVGCV